MIGEFTYLLNGSLTARKSNDSGLSLFATLRCEEDEVSYGPFSVRVFLRRIMLDVHLINGCLSNADPVLGAVQRTHTIDISYELSDISSFLEKTGQTTSANVEVAKPLSLNVSSDLINEQSRSGTETQRYSMTYPLVTFSGGDEFARWSFEAAPQEKYLRGTLLDEARLAKIFGEASNVSGFVVVPKSGVFTSPSRFSTIREQRRLNIFSLLVRKEIVGKHSLKVDLS